MTTTPEQAALAQRILDQCLSLLDDMNAEKARDSLYDHPACQDRAGHGLEYRPAAIRYDQHGCGTGLQCEDCAAAASNRFAAIVGQFGYATCTRCERRFSAHEEFTTIERLAEAAGSTGSSSSP
ncbi:hypothetical protein [Nocardia sp. NPDC004260]